MPTLERRAYKHLRRKLLYGELPPGSPLSDAVLARRIGMSRTPVRHAIRMLESEGLVAQKPAGGSVVRKPGRREVAVLYDLRAMLEGYAVARAAKRVTDAELAALDTLQAQLRALALRIRDEKRTAWDAALGVEMTRIDLKFHRTILRAAQCPEVGRLVEQAHILARLFAQRSELSPLRGAAMVLLIHGRILRHLRRRDGRAARRVMVLSIRDARRRVLRQGRPTEGWSPDIAHADAS
jgi:DNA-binding GntR family transcriptional regulator